MADDIFWSVITPVLLELLKMTLYAWIWPHAKNVIIWSGSWWIKRHWSPQNQKCSFKNFPHFFLLQAMIKCFQSNAPAKKNLFSEREPASLGSALKKVLGATDHETVRGEGAYPRIPAGRFLSCLCLTPLHFRGMHWAEGTCLKPLSRLVSGRAKICNEGSGMPRLQPASIQGLTHADTLHPHIWRGLASGTKSQNLILTSNTVKKLLLFQVSQWEL